MEGVDPREEVVHGVEVEVEVSGTRRRGLSGGVRERERAGVGVVVGGGVAGVAGVGGDSGGELESKFRCDCRRDKRASSAAVPRAKLSSGVPRARMKPLGLTRY